MEKKKEMEEEESKLPASVLCPITKLVMIDPVLCVDGHAYERRAIEKWFLGTRMTSPLTNNAIETRDLTAIHTLKSVIDEIVPHKIIDEHKKELSKMFPEKLGPYHMQQWLDVFDAQDEKWRIATIIGMDPDANTITIHYRGWKAVYDEALHIERDDKRIAPLHQHTLLHLKDNPGQLRATDTVNKGDYIDVLDLREVWCRATVLAVDSAKNRLFVHYLNWSGRYDEHIPRESHCLQKLPSAWCFEFYRRLLS